MNYLYMSSSQAQQTRVRKAQKHISGEFLNINGFYKQNCCLLHTVIEINEKSWKG